MSETSVIDAAVLNSLLESVGSDTEFLAELLQTYFDDSPALFATMRAALAEADCDGFRRAAHSLKSNSANFGAMTLSRMAKSLEDMGKAGTLDGAASDLARAEEEYAKVRAALEAASTP